MIGSSGSDFGGGNPPTDLNVSGFVGDLLPIVGVVDLGIFRLGLGKLLEFSSFGLGWTILVVLQQYFMFS